MKHLLIGITAAATIAAIGHARAQVPPPGPQQAQLVPPAAYLNAPTAHDAYKQGQINRWEFERIAGPLPQAFQGPPVDSARGDSDGGGGRN